MNIILGCKVICECMFLLHTYTFYYNIIPFIEIPIAPTFSIYNLVLSSCKSDVLYHQRMFLFKKNKNILLLRSETSFLYDLSYAALFIF